MKEVSEYNPSKDPRLINCKTECGNERCFAKRYGLFAEKTCPNFKETMPLTNADRLRSMTDEELDKFLGEVQWDVANYCGGVTQKQEYPVPEQRGAWLDWLKQEVVSDG